MRLISQYYEALKGYPFKEQYNYTLLINCMLGLIVMPKEKVISYIPKERLTSKFRKEIGLEFSEVSSDILTLRDLVRELRHAIAHFDINVISEDEERRIDFIEFKNAQGSDLVVAKIKASELLPFLKYYSGCLLRNLERNRH